MKSKFKYIVYVLLGIVLIILIPFTIKYISKQLSENNGSTSEDISADNSELEFLLESFPIDEVPLYKLTEVSSCKLYNNWDPNNTSMFNDKEFSYYNVVISTDAT